MLLIGQESFAFYEGQLSVAGDAHPDTGPVTVCLPNTVTLDGWTYAVDLTEYQFGPQETFRDGVVVGDQPNESLFNANGAWARYRISWHHGADQEVADLDEAADPFRFDTSHGFEPWDRYRLTLLARARIDDDVSVNSDQPLLLRSSTYLYFADDTSLIRTQTGNTWNSVDPTGNSINALATDGNDLYVATSNGLVKYLGSDTAPTAFSTPVTGACHHVAFVANRLLLAKGPVLYSVGASGTLTAIITHYQAGFDWTVMFAIGSRIYVGGHAGVKSELYTLTTDEAGVLVQGQEAAPFPIGEQLLSALSVGGACLLGTSAGVRFAQVGADGTLTYGPLIDTPGSCSAIVAESRFAYVSWNDTTTAGTGHKGVARLDLSTFVDVLQPAYAADVHAHGDIGDVVAIERFSDATWFAGAGSFLYSAPDDADFGDISFETSAQVSSGRLYFGTVEPKGLLELEVDFSPLVIGDQIFARVLDQSGFVVGQGSQDIPDSTKLIISMNGTETREATVEIEVETLGQQDLTIFNWSMRAYPVPPAVLQWVVPLNTHQIVAVGDNTDDDMTQEIRGVVDRVEALHTSRRLVNYLEGGRLYRVRVESFKHQARKWADDGGAPVGVLHVQLVSA